MELETEPLILKDPLDFGSDDDLNEHSRGLAMQLEPQILKEIFSKDLAPGHNGGQISINKLGVRETENLFLPGGQDNPAWHSKPGKVLRTKKLQKKQATEKRIKSENKSTLKENLESSTEATKNLKRKKTSREYYFKKYRIMKGKRSYACDLCNKKFITASHLKEHFLSHNQCFTCEECGKVFNHLRSFQRHVAAGHDPNLGISNVGVDKTNYSPQYSKSEGSDGKYNRCKKYYEQLKSERKYQCDICNKTFITSGHLNAHKYCHSGKKWECEGCRKNFSCERSLIRHKDTFPGKHWFPCQLCDMAFFRVLNIVKHMEIKHPEVLNDEKRRHYLNLTIGSDIGSCIDLSEVKSEKAHVCSECLKIFYSLESLEMHKQAMHSLKNPRNESTDKENNINNLKDLTPNFKCEFCFKEFISLEGFEYHKNNQHLGKVEKRNKKKHDRFCKDESEKETNKELSNANFVCKICSASFFLKSGLQVHLKSHNVTKNIEIKTGSHQCCICPRSFASSDGLKYHLATHTGERRYSCDQCGKKFIKKTHLSEHIATHSEVKYFKCLRCPRTFSTHSAYKKHIKYFPGPHSFHCAKCGKLFTKESMIEKHMCVDLVKITMAPEVKALLSEDMIEEYLCIAEEQAAEESARKSNGNENSTEEADGNKSYIVNSKNLNKVSTQINAYHSCYKCFKVFPNLTSLQSHQFEHIGKQNYQCRFCSQSFKRADAFGSHIRNHLGSTPYMCLKCNRKFISPLTLSMHAKNYPGDHSFTCQKCQRWFPSEKRLEKHECILQNSDTFICACGTMFRSWNELLNHAGSKPYKCCSCDLKYPTLTALARHIKKHTGAKPFSCEVCSKSFRSRSNYLHHQNVHKDFKEIQCEHCEFKSKSQKRMDGHLFRKHKIGTGTSNSILCPICGIIFPYMSHMKKHVEIEHRGELMLDEPKGGKRNLSLVLCTLCGKLLNNKYTLANHMKKFHDPNCAKSDQEFKCEVCDEKFKSSKKLQKHAEIHEAPALRVCEICNKEFYFSKDLRKHMRRHHTNKPYTCLRCGKNFKVSVSLKYHASICGSTNHKNLEKEKFSTNTNMFYDDNEPLDLNSRSYA